MTTSATTTTAAATASPPVAPPVAPPPAVVADHDGIGDVAVVPPLSSAGAGYLLLPLYEFGQSLDSPDLDCWFEGFAGRNRAQAEYEITAQGDLKIMPPTGFPFDWYEAETTADVVLQARRHGGLAGGPTSRFILPDGSRRGPDAWWISPERWNAHRPLKPASPLSPPSSPTLSLRSYPLPTAARILADKIRNVTCKAAPASSGSSTPAAASVTIHRPGTEPEILDDPELLHGDDVIPGFVFRVRQRIFDNIP